MPRRSALRKVFKHLNGGNQFLQGGLVSFFVFEEMADAVGKSDVCEEVVDVEALE